MMVLGEILLGCILLQTVSAHKCGFKSGVQWHCVPAHICCSETLHTCCPYGHLCINGDMDCLHIAVIIVPLFVLLCIVVGVIIFCVLKKKKKKRALQALQNGTDMQPEKQ